jgi:signal peptidase
MASVILDYNSGLPRRVAAKDGLITVLGALAAIFFATNQLLPLILPGGWNLYVAQPAIWLVLGAFCVTQTGFAPARLTRPLLALALLCGAFQVAALLLAGMLYGFGYSGYAHSPAGIAANLWFLGSMLFGVEMARAYLLERMQARPAASFFAVALLFGLMSLSLDQLTALSNGGRPALMLGGERLLPSLATSLLATLLAVIGGPWAAIVYRAVLLGFEWLSPVLPNLPWLPAAVAGAIAPGVAFALVQQMTADEVAEGEVGRDRGDGPDRAASVVLTADRTSRRSRWMLPFAVAFAAAVWFNTGLLGVQPSIVSGISMEPTLTLGDIVITRDVGAASVNAGDVIKFRSGAVSVLHRVQEVRSGPDGLVFITQGDNNNYLDPPVPEAALQGRVVLVVPKLGLVPVTVREWLAR